SVVFQLLFRAIDTLGKSVEAAAAGAEEPADVVLLADVDGESTRAADVSAASPEAPTPGRRISDAPRSRPIQVTIRPGAVMRGARAALVLRRAETLGAVNTVRPALAELERDDFDGRFSFRLQTRLSDRVITAALRAVGDVETIEIVEAVAAGADSQPGANRQIRVDLRRLDLLMKQVGELVVAKNRCGVLSTVWRNRVLMEGSERVIRLVASMQGEFLASRISPVGELFER